MSWKRFRHVSNAARREAEENEIEIAVGKLYSAETSPIPPLSYLVAVRDVCPLVLLDRVKSLISETCLAEL